MSDILKQLSEYGPGIASIFAGLGVLLAAIQFIWSNRQHHKTELQALEARKIEIYQKLEFESTAIFRFETEHRAILSFYKSNLHPQAAHPEGVDAESANITARKYYEICCNIFEVAVRLRDRSEPFKSNNKILNKIGFYKKVNEIQSKKYIEDEVFGSWIAWFFDTACEWGFRAVWHDLRDNYTPQLRCKIFDPIVQELIVKWDTPHGQHPNVDLRKSEEDLKRIRESFYQAVGKQFGCESLACGWVNDTRKDAFERPPRAFI